MPDHGAGNDEQPVIAIAQPLLPYSDIESPDLVTEVTVNRSRPHVRCIYIPVSSGWWPVFRPIAYAFIGVAGVLGIAILAGHLAVKDFSAFPTVMVFIVIGSLASGWNGRIGGLPLPRRVAFEITPYALHMTTAGVFGVSRSQWPRSTMYEVRLNELKHVLELRISRFDFLTVFVSGNQQITKTVYAELKAALSEIPAAPKEDQLLQPDPAAGLPPSPLRTLFHRGGIALLITAVVAAPFTHGWSLLLVIPSTALVGIAVGVR